MGLKQSIHNGRTKVIHMVRNLRNSIWLERHSSICDHGISIVLSFHCLLVVKNSHISVISMMNWGNLGTLKLSPVGNSIIHSCRFVIQILSVLVLIVSFILIFKLFLLKLFFIFPPRILLEWIPAPHPLLVLLIQHICSIFMSKFSNLSFDSEVIVYRITFTFTS